MGLCQQYAQLWPPEERDVAQAVCRAESLGGDPNAYNGNGERSRGLWQINGAAHPQWDNDSLFDPEVNAQVAYSLWQAQGWRPWTTYTGGAYRKYLQGGSDGSTEAPAATGGAGSNIALGPLLLAAAVTILMIETF